MNPAKKCIKKLLIGKQNIRYNYELKSKKTDYNKWVLQQEQLSNLKNPFLGQNVKCQTIGFDGKRYESCSSENDRELAESEQLCKLIEIVEESKSENCKAQYLVSGSKNLPKAYETAVNLGTSINAVILMNYPGEFSDNAILKIHDEFQKNKNLIVIYSDEDMTGNDGKRYNPWYKPDWAPDDFLSYMYFGGFAAVRFDSMKEVKPKDDDNGYSYLYKLLLMNRAFDCHTVPATVCHISEVLYHTHGVCGYEYIKNERLKCQVKERISDVLVSIVIPSKDHPEILFKCVDSVMEVTGLLPQIKLEIVLIDNGSNDTNRSTIESLVENYSQSAKIERIEYIYEPHEFNFAYLCNKGAQAAKGNYLLFLNDDMEIIDPDWLNKLVEKAHLPYAGAVGAKLLYPKSLKPQGNIIQHAGITNLRIGPAHKLQFLSDDTDHYYGRNRLCHDMMGVTGACLMVKREVFDEVGGFDENLAVAFNDVDLCYSIYEKGYYNIQRNDVVLLHYESLSRGNDSESEQKQLRLNKEKDYLYSKHRNLYGKDPFYNINLTTDMLEAEYAPKFHYEVDLSRKWAKTEDVTSVINEARHDRCVRVGMECAMDIFKWKYGVKYSPKEECNEEDFGYYFQGYTFVIGANNACYERQLLLKNRASGRIYGIETSNEYRGDIAANIPDQLNVDLAGFTAKIAADSLPEGNYQFGMYMKDRTSKQRLYNWSNWTIDIEGKKGCLVNENRI